MVCKAPGGGAAASAAECAATATGAGSRRSAVMSAPGKPTVERIAVGCMGGPLAVNGGAGSPRRQHETVACSRSRVPPWAAAMACGAITRSSGRPGSQRYPPPAQRQGGVVNACVRRRSVTGRHAAASAQPDAGVGEQRIRYADLAACAGSRPDHAASRLIRAGKSPGARCACSSSSSACRSSQKRSEVPNAAARRTAVSGSDAALAQHDFVDTARRDAGGACQCVLADAQRLEKLLKQNFARWILGRTVIDRCIVLSGNRRFRPGPHRLPSIGSRCAIDR